MDTGRRPWTAGDSHLWRKLTQTAQSSNARTRNLGLVGQGEGCGHRMYGEDSCGYHLGDGEWAGRREGWWQLESRGLRTWACGRIHIEGEDLGVLRSSISTAEPGKLPEPMGLDIHLPRHQNSKAKVPFESAGVPPPRPVLQMRKLRPRRREGPRGQNTLLVSRQVGAVI